MGNILESFSGTAAAAAGAGEIYDNLDFLHALCDKDCLAARKADPEATWKDMQSLLADTRSTWTIIQYINFTSTFIWLLPGFGPIIDIILEIVSVFLFDSIWKDV